ncbi:MAG: ribonuclease H-like domain-containing protein [Candidatus Acidiferrum sp.]
MGNGNDKFARLAALKPTRAMPAKPSELRAPDETDPISQLLGGGIARNHYGEHLAIRNWFSTPEFAEASPVTLDLLGKAPASLRSSGQAENGRYKNRVGDESIRRRTRAALEDPGKWLFLDTETTGLAGGTGTYAFLVGLAWWDAGGLQVEQLFLRDLYEEHSLLQELSERIAERPVLVTFNGKAFDWPLLESRFTMTRAIRVPQLAAHLDLLHPARALWKLRLGSVRLVELERQVLDAARLGWHREDDVASSLIPQYYFDYLRGAAARPLAGVVKHNQMDLRGLAALFGKINSLLERRENGFGETDSLDLFGLSKFLQRRGEKELAHSACAQALDAGLPAEFRPQATRELALMAKRRGDLERAAGLWHKLVGNAQETILACEQLAIHYERHERDFARAMEFTQLGLRTLQGKLAGSRDPYISVRQGRLERKFVCRLERLRHRINSANAAPGACLLDNATTVYGSRLRTR